MKYLMILFIFCLSLYARENPFADVISKAAFPVSTNMPKVKTDISRETYILPNTALVVKRVIIEYQNLDGSVQKLVKELDKKIDWHMPLNLSHTKAPDYTNRYKQKVKLPFISFATKANKMKVLTKDPLIRHFMLPKPHRIVLDFKGSSHFLAKKYSQFTKPFKRVRLGNHDGFYRVVVELDGQYEYQEKTDSHGITLSVR